jgi:hypothetical protein
VTGPFAQAYCLPCGHSWLAEGRESVWSRAVILPAGTRCPRCSEPAPFLTEGVADPEPEGRAA